MRVRFYPGSPPPYDACAQYRLLLPAAALQAEGVDVAEGERQLPVTRRGDKVVGAEPLPADVAVFQRMSLPDTVDCFKYWQRHGTAIVVDVDDLIADIPRNNASWRAFNGDKVHWRYLDEACAQADLVTVSTPALAAKYGAHGRVRLLRNCVPTRYFAVAGERRTLDREEGAATSTGNARRSPLLGWAGNLATHRDDLKVMGSAVAIALQRTGARFRALGDPRTLRELGIEGDCVPWVDFEAYPEALAQLDVGLAPLADNAFNRAKSALKLLDGAACGVAMVGSPSPEYRWAHKQGMGLLAENHRQWKGQLIRLLTDRAFREDVAGRSREAVSAWTYEGRCGEWVSAWQAALEHRRGAVAA